MALPPEMQALKQKLNAISDRQRTESQNKLLLELEFVDRHLLQKSITESIHASETRMTSPGGGSCACCGR